MIYRKKQSIPVAEAHAKIAIYAIIEILEKCLIVVLREDSVDWRKDNKTKINELVIEAFDPTL